MQPAAARCSPVAAIFSRDNTATTFIQAIARPQLAVLLNHATDKRNLDPKLAPLGTLEGSSRGYRLLADSPAVGAAIAGQTMVDQRGVIRNSSADSGASGCECPRQDRHPRDLRFADLAQSAVHRGVLQSARPRRR